MMVERDTRSRRWLLTLPENEYDRSTVEAALANYVYIGQLEKGEETSYLHWQIAVENPTAIRFSTLRSKFPRGHFEQTRGTVAQAVAYVTKTDTFAGVRVSNGEVDLDSEENQGHRSDLDRMRQMILDGASPDDVLLEDPRAFRYGQHLRDLAAARDTRRFRTEVRKVTAEFITGRTGVGKTYRLHQLYGTELFRVTDYQRDPFQNYDGQTVLALDEYASQLPIQTLLNLADGYPMQLSSRYRNLWAQHTRLVVVSNLRFGDLYPEVQRESPETWAALKRRFGSIKEQRAGGLFLGGPPTSPGR